MLKELLDLGETVSLICNSGIQFIDFGFNEKDVRFSRWFAEEPLSMTEGSQPTREGYALFALEQDMETDTLLVLPERVPCTSQGIYSVAFANALAAYEDTWLPLPYLALIAEHREDAERYAFGPTNWARMRIIRLEEPDSAGNTHRVVIAFDTRPSLDEKRDGRPYPCPDLTDVEDEIKFELARRPEQHFWFLGEIWVSQWLENIFQKALDAKKKGVRRPIREDDHEAICAHWAFFSVLIEGLAEALQPPRVYFLNTISEFAAHRPIDVDLVLDIGNSRTCGVLIEMPESNDLDLRDTVPLELRDLGRPHQVYKEPFRSHVEFAWPDFGPLTLSRRAGNLEPFLWPSWMRVGNEALRLHSKSTGNEGDTGLSAPKRYLLDEEEMSQLWYYNTAESRPEGVEDCMQASLQGHKILSFITPSGDPLKTAEDPVPAIQSKFSRASLFTFMLMEIFIQAIQQINSPSHRGRRARSRVPRRLRNIILTVPSATPLVEIKAFDKRTAAAIDLLWDVMEWHDARTGAPPRPEFHIRYDEASCTQIVYLFTEITQRFRRSAGEYFTLFSESSDESAASASMRIASLDIGGGTTDLMISTYSVQHESEGDTILLQQNFREGFRIAGDDILEAIVVNHVLGQIEDALQEAGMPNARFHLRQFNSDANKDALMRHKRRLFVTQVMMPIALGMLSRYEQAEIFDSGVDPLPFEDFFDADNRPDDDIIAFFEQGLPEAVRERFSLRDMRFAIDFHGIARSVRAVIGERVIGRLAEVIGQFGCDVLLVSGRPSRLPVIRDLLLRVMPVAPHNILFMDDYEVGDWYPFASAMGRIDDPKTTVVMGALICSLAESRRINNFSIASGGFRLLSTARYIGPMELDGTIAPEKVFFTMQNGEFETESRPMTFTQPVYIGYRQLPHANWPATQLYHAAPVDDNPERMRRTMPWKVTFTRKEPQEDMDDNPQVEKKQLDESFRVGAIFARDGQQIANSRLRLRLQTLREQSGYWLDTGRLNL